MCTVDTDTTSIVNVRGIDIETPFITVDKDTQPIIKQTIGDGGQIVIEGNELYSVNNYGAMELVGYAQNCIEGNSVIGIGSITPSSLGTVIHSLIISDIIDTVEAVYSI